MSDSIKLGSVADEDWATVKCLGGDIDFQSAPGYQPPARPDPSSSMQMHLDFLVDDADAAGAWVLAAGATKFDVQPGDHFRVYADPAGHPSFRLWRTRYLTGRS